MVNQTTHNVFRISKSVTLLYLFCIIVEVLFTLKIQIFYLYSGLFILSSIFISLIIAQWSKQVSEKTFLTVTTLTTFIYGLLLIWISSQVAIYEIGTPFVGLDDAIYDEQQRQIAKNIRTFHEISSQTLMSGFYSGYPNFGGILMYLFGSDSWWIPRIANIFLHSMSLPLFYSIIKHYSSTSGAKIASILFGLSPIFLTYAIFQMKDSNIIFLVLLIFILIRNILKGERIVLSIAIAIPTLAALIFYRAMIILALVISILLSVLFSGTGKKKVFSTAAVSVLVVGVFILWGYISSSGLATGYNDYFGRRLTLLGDEERLAGGGSTLTESGYGSLVSAPLFITMSPLLPIPGAILFEDPKYPSTNLNFSGNLFLYAILPLALIGAFWTFKRRKEAGFPFLILLFFFVYKIGSAISGMTIWSYRQNMPATLTLLMLLPIGLDTMMTKQENRARKLILLLSYFLIFIWSGFRYIIRL